MGGWKVGSWGADRGPDPITEHAKFAKNVLKNLSKKPFEGEICELLLDQKYFNGMCPCFTHLFSSIYLRANTLVASLVLGIGNYLRAEVMYRAGISPFSVAHDVFKNTSRNLDFNSVNEASDKGLIVLYLCKKIPEEVIEQGRFSPSPSG
jgi:endonuclease VIII-like 1